MGDQAVESLLCEVRCVQPLPNETVVISLREEGVRYRSEASIKRVLDTAKDAFPDNRVVVLDHNLRLMAADAAGMDVDRPLAVGVSETERRTIRQLREQGRERVVEGTKEILVCIPLSFWVAADDLDAAGHRAGAMIEEKLCPVAWDSEGMGRGVADKRLRKGKPPERKSLKSLLFGRRWLR